MATDKKISDLTVATTPSGAELVEIVQGGVNKQTTLQAIADLAGDEHFLGVYVSEAALISAHATASSGDYAFVDAGAASPVELWIWDNDDSEWVQTGSGGVVPPASETTQGIAELATQAETNTGTDDVRAVTPLKLNTKLRLTRTEDGVTAPALVQTDDNSIIILNSATPFNFTLDQITSSSKVSFMNIGAGAVTLVAGSGVTITGSVVIPGAVGTEYPSAFVFYHTATTPRVAIGGAESGRVAVAISTGTLTLDINNEIRRDFDLTATESSNFTIAFSNTTNWKESSLTMRLTGTIAITMPSNVRMDNFENTHSRWNTSTRVLTLTGVTASGFYIVFIPTGSTIYCQAGDRQV